MSAFGGFLKRNRMMIIIPSVLAGEFYLWWRMQQMECYVPKEERKEIFVKPLEYAQKLYAGSNTDDRQDAGKKTL